MPALFTREVGSREKRAMPGQEGVTSDVGRPSDHRSALLHVLLPPNDDRLLHYPPPELNHSCCQIGRGSYVFSDAGGSHGGRSQLSVPFRASFPFGLPPQTPFIHL